MIIQYKKVMENKIESVFAVNITVKSAKTASTQRCTHLKNMSLST